MTRLIHRSRIFFGIIPNGVGGVPNGSIAIGVGNTWTAHSNFVVNNNAWRHVTITRSTTGATVFYVNGQQTNTGTGTAGEIAAGRTFDRLGMAVAGGNFNGQLDEVRLFNSIQNADKIRADFKYMMNTHLNYSAMDMP
ncbi:LamG domain-containing protein [bacterium]|nr:LamG domain-containing protein [bacterium]